MTPNPDLAEYRRQAASPDVDIVPVQRTLVVDMETPLAIYRKIANGTPNSFLLESVTGGEKWARYSFMASEPRLIFRSTGNQVTLEKPGAKPETYTVDDPLAELDRLLASNRALPHPRFRFAGGAVGFLSYDMIRFVERIPDRHPRTLPTPDSLFYFTDLLVVHDAIENTVTLIANTRPKDFESPDLAYGDAMNRLDALARRIRQRAEVPPVQLRQKSDSAFVSNMKAEEYMAGVLAAKEHIKAGDVFQLVLSQRFTLQEKLDPFDLYRALRLTNPSPYMFFINAGDFSLVGSSPEVMVRMEDGVITNRPIAGTRRRGATEAEDAALEADMLADPKERAEHIMLVDLGRNDLGRVSIPGTVKVDELMTVERYSQVMHIVSNVTGKIAPGRRAMDVFRATFPAGTLTGAPKIRAMEIIDRLEVARRGPYGGAVGYFDYAGNMDTCIAIRTFLVTPDAVHVQAGAGLVADSDPPKEQEECINKARGLFKAVERLSAGKGWE